MGTEEKAEGVVKVANHHRVKRSESAEKMTIEEQKEAVKQKYDQMSRVKLEQDEPEQEEHGMLPQM